MFQCLGSVTPDSVPQFIHMEVHISSKRVSAWRVVLVIATVGIYSSDISKCLLCIENFTLATLFFKLWFCLG